MNAMAIALTAAGALIIAGILAAIRCALDYFGIWPIDYSDDDDKP